MLELEFGVGSWALRVEAVSVAIAHPDGTGKLLIVRRPMDDPDLPGAWGLPAASIRAGESTTDAVRRAARDKLGITLELGPEMRRGSTRRGDTVLSMTLFAANVQDGDPSVPQPVDGVTQYTALRWDTPDALRPAAIRGSLCCRLALEAMTGA